MIKNHRQALRSIATLALWFVLIGLSLTSCLRVKGYPLTPTATTEIRPGWEVISFGMFIGSLVVEYVISAVVVGIIFRVLPDHNGSMEDGKSKDELRTARDG